MGIYGHMLWVIVTPGLIVTCIKYMLMPYEKAKQSVLDYFIVHMCLGFLILLFVSGVVNFTLYLLN